ncbi:RNA polymerase sigma factor [Roseateles saccharophilus]|uniref:RNA polymerase sigma-70 factor (ECF subfamily) n=1 Tax=Roseateles saccharophilus TaxID=304 RepID=A0A4V2VPN4_ROSSA|nr:sigma-70 family RNA polymerase sigma factor [Roseateles saccharophilus]MDG0834129.1 sigma-70 family RNA polymerase sigma factor [Roseateles saccharophilus]TCU91349.1 RNA polymerase sigma-70 factor (ECF subfamily) [Roseateles saccharophilus]
MSARPLKNWQDVLARVRGALRRRGRTEHEAEDLVQEAWLRLARYEDEKQPVEKPEAFLMRTALNLSIDTHRMNSGRGEHMLLEDVVLIDTTPSTEAVLLARERMARLTQGLGRLSEKTRDVFLANRLDGLPYTEIAKLHGISVATVQYHVAKATLRLTSWMEGW